MIHRTGITALAIPVRTGGLAPKAGSATAASLIAPNSKSFLSVMDFGEMSSNPASSFIARLTILALAFVALAGIFALVYGVLADDTRGVPRPTAVPSWATMAGSTGTIAPGLAAAAARRAIA